MNSITQSLSPRSKYLLDAHSELEEKASNQEQKLNLLAQECENIHSQIDLASKIQQLQSQLLSIEQTLTAKPREQLDSELETYQKDFMAKVAAAKNKRKKMLETHEQTMHLLHSQQDHIEAQIDSIILNNRKELQDKKCKKELANATAYGQLLKDTQNSIDTFHIMQKKMSQRVCQKTKEIIDDILKGKPISEKTNYFF